jgi:hypothetical protein
MNQDPVEEASQWLSQLVADLEESRLYDKTPYDMRDRIVWEIQRYTPGLQEAVRAALRRWLHSGDSAKVRTAVWLIGGMQATEFIPDLQRLRDKEAQDSSGLACTDVEVLEDVIAHLAESEGRQP